MLSDTLDNVDPRAEKALAMVRGVLFGLAIVVAAGVWAANFEVLLTGKASGGALGLIVRLFLCDAVPLATLYALYQGLGRNESIEGVLREIFRAIYWFRTGSPTPRSPSEELRESFVE